ncbi:MAG: amino acid adenylation domain-containing protein, partial [Chromatiales bacterium]
MSAISKLTTELSPEEKRALLAQLLQKKASQSKSLLPLSPGQQALWFLYTLAPQSWTYNVLFAARIRSPVDVPALQRAFGALIDRHPSLRTTYTLREGRLVQQVHEHTHVHFEETDASTCTQTALNNRLVEEARRPFDLERGPLLRVNLFTQSATEHILLLTMHHIAVDFWSLTVLLDELRVLYPAQRAGTQAPLLPLDWQYTDYVRWQTEMLASGEGERLWTYWQKQLAGELPVLNLPTDRPRPPIQTYRGASHAFKLSEELTQKIKALAKTEEATLYITLLAAFQVLLYRYTGQKDILVGSPAPGRSRREFSGIVGDFINPVVLRADLSGNPTFKPFLTQVRHTVLNALNHQDYPFPLLIERLRLTQDPSRSPLFGVMLIVRKLHRFEELSAFIEPSRIQAKMNFGGLEIEPFDLVQQEGQYDLTLAMIETGGLLFGVFKYKPDLFEAATIARMSGHFQTLLEGVVTNPNQPISTLPLLRAAERHQLLVEWNDTQVDYPKDACIHQLFEAQVERAPEAIAVVFEDQQLSYRELNGRANQLAHHLIGLGVGPGVLVGILVERSLNMIVGLLGILKAGGAYVPLEPAYPTERLGFMLSDAALPVVVTQQGFDSRLPANGAKLVWLDSDRSAIAAQPDHNPVNRDADALAYVIYTSGSTGTPKGVMVEHGSLVNYSASAVADYALRATDRVLQFASINFDASAEEIYPSLIQGATLVLRNDEMLSSAAQFLRTCADWKVSVLSVPTAWWHEIAASVIPEELTIPPSLRLVIIGGEAAAAGRLASWQQWTGSRVELINTYGPTEATVVATRWKAPLAINDLAAVPIGRPIANTQVYLLDPRLSPAPIGVAGELHIGGAGLARGYLNRPELTADKFIPNPFSDETNARLYKTGDLARYLPDGNIEFLGRMDHQVKIRGFRIELGEIESVLNEHPDVKVCAVIAREDQPNDKRLVAYIVSAEPPPVASGVLRESLRQKLPDYMLPSAFIGLDKLPLTPNGKLDRKALPAPDRLRSDSAPVAPRTPLEQQLAAIFASVLKIDRVGIHDNFFDLGGHSFLVLRVLAEIEKACGRRLSVATLFQAPTVEEIGRILTAGDSFDD